MDELIFSILIFGGGSVAFIWFRMKFWEGYAKGKAKQRETLAKMAQEGYKPWGEPWSQEFGSAYFMTPDQIAQSGNGYLHDAFIEKRKHGIPSLLLLGRTTFKKKSGVPVLERPGHLITIAPTRSGKGVSAVIPNLLMHQGSVIVNDIKGENFAVCARRRRAMGQKVFKFAPFDDGSNCWNPFDSIAEGEDAWEDARALAELLVASPADKEVFWDNEARNVLSAVILHIHTGLPPEERNMSQVRHLLTQDREEFDLLLAQMATSEHALVQRAASSFLGTDDKVRANVLSTLNSHMSIWDSPKLAKIMHRSDFDFGKIKQEPTSIFFCLPPERLAGYAPVVRLFMGMAVHAMTRNKAKPDDPVLFMLDEFPALGRVRAIEDGIAYLAGYGVRLWMFAQDLKQLAACYGDKTQTLLANTAVKQFFGVADHETAQLVSHMCGQMTVPTVSYSGETGLILGLSNTSVGGSARSLMTPDEIMSRTPDLQFLFFQNQRPITAVKFNYLEEVSFFSDKDGPVFDPNPYHD